MEVYVDSNRDIEQQYKDELFTFFNSGVFLFNQKFNNNPIHLQNALLEYYSNEKLKRLTKRLFDRVSTYHKNEFDFQMPASSQNKLIKIEDAITDANITNPDNQDTGIKFYTEQLQFFNYITARNLRDDFIHKILTGMLLQELFNTPKQLETEIMNQAVSKLDSRIELISSDQVIKINSGLTMVKAIALGFNEYKWQTMEDDRVRHTHAENNQKLFSWSNPPSKTGHPGTDPGCRCRAIIIVNRNMGNLLELI